VGSHTTRQAVFEVGGHLLRPASTLSCQRYFASCTMSARILHQRHGMAARAVQPVRVGRLRNSAFNGLAAGFTRRSRSNNEESRLSLAPRAEQPAPGAGSVCALPPPLADVLVAELAHQPTHTTITQSSHNHALALGSHIRASCIHWHHPHSAASPHPSPRIAASRALAASTVAADLSAPATARSARRTASRG
jgi:hypothetical protein